MILDERPALRRGQFALTYRNRRGVFAGAETSFEPVCRSHLDEFLASDAIDVTWYATSELFLLGDPWCMWCRLRRRQWDQEHREQVISVAIASPPG